MCGSFHAAPKFGPVQCTGPCDRMFSSIERFYENSRLRSSVVPLFLGLSAFFVITGLLLSIHIITGISVYQYLPVASLGFVAAMFSYKKQNAEIGLRSKIIMLFVFFLSIFMVYLII